MAKTYKSDTKVEEIRSNLDWFPLFYRDWLMDVELSSCSLTAQGLLVRIMTHSWPNGGVITINKSNLLSLCGREDEKVILDAFAELVSMKRIIVDGSIDNGEVTITVKRLKEISEKQVELLYHSWVPKKEVARKNAAKGRKGGKAKVANSKEGSK